MKEFEAYISKKRNPFNCSRGGIAVDDLSTRHPSSDTLIHDATEEKDNAPNLNVGRAASEQLIRRALGILSKIISGNVMISKYLWEYLGGSKVIPYDIFVRLGMDQMDADLPRFPFSFKNGETMPARGEMVSISFLL